MSLQDDPRNFALSLTDDGLVSIEYLLVAALKYMSHDDVRGMLEANDLLDLDEDEDEDED